MLVWLSVWSEVQMICIIWFSSCHCYSIFSCFIKILNGSAFWCRLTQVVLKKKPLNVCSIELSVTVYVEEIVCWWCVCLCSWSFGVCLWEIYSYGDSPFPSVPLDRLYRALCDGYQMPRPQAAHQSMSVNIHSLTHTLCTAPPPPERC